LNEHDLQQTLSDLPLGGLRYFPSIGSTNDEALVWGAQGAPDLSMVVADEQTAGRGRSGRKWFTPAGSALAFSLILRPPAGSPHPTRTVGLAALAVAESLRTRSLAPLIKWPNDILVDEKKVAGILLESVWIGSQVDFTIVGIGVNIARSAVPPPELLNYPAASLEEALGARPDRNEILHDIISALLQWRARIDSDAFMQAWEDSLAFRGRQVQVWEENDEPITGELLGLASDGSLRLRAQDGRLITLSFGDVRLRPAL
jgi:BirA family transcriptional regulator, biotin operon repressor / biotin---[acetyl-CoA-carboxylase] ligase